MSRKVPTTTLDVIGPLGRKPEEAVGEYIESKKQDEFFVKPPNWDSAGDTIELLYIRNQRERDAMHESQQELLQNMQKEHNANMQRVRQAYKMQSFLRRRFIEVNSFMRDCSEKKRNAEKKVAGEVALHKELNKSIKENREAVQTLEIFRQALKHTTAQYEPYEKVLEDVVRESDIYVSIKDLMDRCDALMMAQMDITKLEFKKIQEIEEMHQKMIKITNEAALRILGMKNVLTELERSYNLAYAKCHRWENILSETKNVLAYNDHTYYSLLDTVHNTFRLLCKRQGIEPNFHRHEVEHQMDFIKDEIEILTEVLNRYEELEEKSGKKQRTTSAKIPC